MKKIFTVLLFTLLSGLSIHAASYYIAGDGNSTTGWCCGKSWKAGDCEMQDNTYTTTVPAGTYQFKVTDGTWNNSWGYDAVDTNTSTPGFKKNDSNVKFEVTSEATITVSFNGDTKKITLTSTVPFGGPTNIYVRGDFNDWGESNKMSTSDNDTYTCTINFGKNQTKNFKLTIDGSWTGKGNNDGDVTISSDYETTMEVGKGANIKLKTSTTTDGDYTFTYVLSTNKFTLTYPTSPTPSEHTVKVGGYKSDTGVEDFNLTSSDNDTFTGSVSLSANYQFKIDVDGTKYSDASTFTETATKTLNSSSGRNYLTICTSGEYQFKYVISTKQLTITYPTCPVVQHTVKVGGYSKSVADFDLTSVDNEIFTGSVNLSSEYQFKLTLDGDADHKYSDDSHYTGTATKTLETGKGRNYIDVSQSGEYQFQFVYSTKQLTVTYPDSPTPSQHTVKVGGYKSDTGVEDFNLTSSDNDTFTGSVSLSANYQFKIDVDGTKYSDASTFTETATKTLNSSSGRNHLTICTSGEYQFKYVVSTKKLTVTYPECPVVYPSVQVRGIGSWDGVEMDTEDGENYTKTFTLYSNVEFKLYYNDKWYSSGGTVTKDNCTDLDFSKTEGNAKLEITNAGDYTFSFVYSTKKLSVTYPTLDNPTVVTVSSADVSQGTVSPAEVEVNATSSAQITATGINGYKFSTWSLTGCTTDDALTSATINVKGDGESATGTAVASFEEDPDAKVIYFVNTYKWESPYIYFWDPEKKSWPGDAMVKTTMTATSEEYEVWSYTYSSGTYAKCKFNCGPGCTGETTNTDVNVGKFYYELTKTWYATLEEIPEPEYITLVYVNKAGWSNVNIQMKGGSSSMDWPGVAMTKSDDKKFGIDVYTYTFMKGQYTNYIINKGDGGGQIEKNIEEGKYVHYNGVRYATLDAIPLPSLAGDFNGWSADANTFELNEEGVGSTTITLEANAKPEFMVIDGQMLGNTGTMTHDNCTNWTMSYQDGGGNNCKIQVRNKGEFTFTYDVKTSKLSVTYPEFNDKIDLIVTNAEGENVIEMTKNPSAEKEYYKYDLFLRTGDVVTFYDHYSLKAFKPKAIDSGASMSDVATITDNGLEITQSINTNFYLILEAGNDKVQLQHGYKVLDEIAPNAFLSEIKDQTVDLHIYRPLDTQSYSTLCLPFALDASQLEYYFPNAQIAKLTSAEVEKRGVKYITTLNFTKVSAIEAGMPYIILPSEDITEIQKFEDVTVTVTDGQTQVGEIVDAVGILKPTTLYKDAYNYLFLGADNKLFYPNVTGNLKGMRSYFYVKDDAPANLLMGATPKQLKAFPALMTIGEPETEEGLTTEAGGESEDAENKPYKIYNENNEVIIIYEEGKRNLAGQQVD